MNPPQPNPDDAISEILDFVQDYTIQSSLGGTPFKTQEENEAENLKAYENGRAEAHRRLTALMVEGQIAKLQKLKPLVHSHDGNDFIADILDNEISDLQQQLKKEDVDE